MGGNLAENVLTTNLALYGEPCCRKSIMKLAKTFCWAVSILLWGGRTL